MYLVGRNQTNGAFGMEQPEGFISATEEQAERFFRLKVLLDKT